MQVGDMVRILLNGRFYRKVGTIQHLSVSSSEPDNHNQAQPVSGHQVLIKGVGSILVPKDKLKLIPKRR